MLGADQGVKHAPADLEEDIHYLMASLNEHKVYQIQKGRTFEDESQMVPDVIATGLQKLTEGTNSPLNDYNAAFRRLQQRRKMKPVSPKDIPTSSCTSIPAASPSVFTTEATSAANLPGSSTPIASNPIPAEEYLPEDQVTDEDGLSMALQCIDDMENGRTDDLQSLARKSPEDVALDMDKVFIEEDKEEYFTDSSSDPDNASEASSEDSVEEDVL